MPISWKVAIGIILGLIIIVVLSIWAIRVPRWPDWTGINHKTAWDFVELIIVPFVLTAGGIIYSLVQRRVDRKREFERQKLAIMLAYNKELVSTVHELKNKREDAEQEQDAIDYIEAQKTFDREVERIKKLREQELAYLEELKNIK